ncbi:MAG: outer membrane receptor protein involved in Fe transport [Flavobacteriales bacterium]|jgi:outer membrane receptor protein involved in Fe transport
MKQLLLSVASAFLFLAVQAQSDVLVQVYDLGSMDLVEGLTIIATNDNTSIAKEGISDANGKVRIRLNTTGTYTISIKENEKWILVEGAKVNIRSNEDASVSILVYEQKNVALAEAEVAAGQSIATQINTRNAEVSSELTAKEINEIPLEGRDITRALFRLPNITQATGFYPEAPNVAINGANSLFTNYLIDGMDNNENFLGGQRFNIPVGFTDNITVLTNNFSAEYGNTANGVINITTKSGSNKETGEVFYITRPGAAIDAESRFAQRDLSGNQVKDGFQRHQAGFGLGGALKENKTFYYINAEYTRDIKDNLLNSPALGVNTTIQGKNEFTYLSGRLDHHWSDKFHSMVRVNAGIVGIERQGGGLDGGVTFASAGNTQTRNSLNIATRQTYFGSNWTSETNYLYGRFLWDYAEPNNPESPNVSVLDPSEQTIAILGHPGYRFADTENTHQIHQKFTIYGDGHTLKIGAQAKLSSFALFGGGNPNGSYTVKLTQDQLDNLSAQNLGAGLDVNNIPSDVEVLNYGVELRQAAFEGTQNIYSIYAEDQIDVSGKLNVNIGLRYDYDDLSKGGNSEGDFNNVAPRLSFNYKLTPRSAIRGGYGLFYEKILYAVYSDALQFNSTSEDYQRQLQELVNLGVLPEDTDISAITNAGNIGGTFNDVAYLEGPQADQLQDQSESIFQNELRVINPDGYDNPYSHQFTLGYQYQVKKNTLFYVDLVHNQSHNLFRVRNLNAPEAYDIDPDNVVVRPADEADLSRPVPIFNDANGTYALASNGDTLRGIARNVVMTETGGRSRYYAASFTLNKGRGVDNYSFRVVYTLSLLENNTEDINFRAMDSNDFGAEWGPSINDRTHVINSFVTYYPFKNFSATLAALLQSGQPINRIPDALLYGTTDLNGDGRAFGDAYVGNSDRSPGEERNSDRLPWATTFDLSLNYNVPFKNNNGALQVTASIFNLMNAENLSGYSNNASQSNQIQVGPADSGLLVRRNSAPPRQFQFGLRYSF